MSTSREESDDVSNGSLTKDQAPYLAHKEGYAEEDGEIIHMTFTRAMVLIGMSFLWSTSQIPLYFYGGIERQIIEDLGGSTLYVWIALGNLIPLGIITPFVGALSDLFGRKAIGVASFVLVIVGNIVCATAHDIRPFIVGSCLMGAGAGTGELVSLAVAGEIAPTKNRGIYIGGMIMTIIPFCPAVLYAQLVAYSSSWRWCGLIIGGWGFIGLVITVIWYRPPPRQLEYTRKELLQRIDYVGGFLSAAAITLFLVGLTLPVQNILEYSWSDPRVLVLVILGLVLFGVFVLWEWRFAPHPMFPRRLGEKNARVLWILLIVTFVSGANFFAVLVFWPTQYQNVYAANNAISQAVGTLPVGFGIIIGSIVCTAFVSILKGKIRLLMVISAVIMTVGNGALAAANESNLGVVYFILCLATLGTGAVIVPCQVISGIVVPEDLLATITAATIAARILGGSIAYTIYEDIFTSKVVGFGYTKIAPLAEKLGIRDAGQIEYIVQFIKSGSYNLLNETALTGVTKEEQVRQLTVLGREVLVMSYPIVYYVSIPFGAVAIIASCFLTGIGDLMTDGAAVKIM